MHGYSELSPTVFSRTFSQVNLFKVIALLYVTLIFSQAALEKDNGLDRKTNVSKRVATWLLVGCGALEARKLQNKIVHEVEVTSKVHLCAPSSISGTTFPKLCVAPMYCDTQFGKCSAALSTTWGCRCILEATSGLVTFYSKASWPQMALDVAVSCSTWTMQWVAKIWEPLA